MGTNPAVRAARNASAIWLLIGSLALLISLGLIVLHLLPIITQSPELLADVDNLLWLVTATIAMILGVYAAYHGSTYYLKPQSYPFLKSLARYGDPLDVIEHIEKERTLDEMQVVNLSLTPNWLIYTKNNNYRAMRYEDIVWFYTSEAHTSGYGRSYSVHVCNKYGERMGVFAQNRNQANTMIKAIAQRAPWAVRERKSKTQKRWNTQRDQLIAEVQQRRQQAQQAVSAS